MDGKVCSIESLLDKYCPQTQTKIYKCQLDQAKSLDYQSTQKTGKVIFRLLKGNDFVHQRVELPRLNFPEETGREIMAVWEPLFKLQTIGCKRESSKNSYFYTDANAFEIVKREIAAESSNEPFAKTLYPIDSVIKFSDATNTNMLSVWNDRPQAGAVHYDGRMKLLIDRRTILSDGGGNLDKMVMDFPDDLILDFKVKMHKFSKNSPADAQRQRGLQAVQFSQYAISQHLASENLKDYENY